MQNRKWLCFLGFEAEKLEANLRFAFRLTFPNLACCISLWSSHCIIWSPSFCHTFRNSRLPQNLFWLKWNQVTDMWTWICFMTYCMLKDSGSDLRRGKLVSGGFFSGCPCCWKMVKKNLLVLGIECWLLNSVWLVILCWPRLSTWQAWVCNIENKWEKKWIFLKLI